jgi:hypothetical protein
VAITVTHMTNGTANPPGTSPSLNSVAFQNNRLYLVTFVMRGGTTPDVTAVTGGGITWTKTTTTRATAPFMAQYRGLATSGASTASLACTVTGTPTMFKYTIEEFAGVNVTTPIVQTAAFVGGSNGDGSVTLSALGDAVNNVAYGVFGEGITDTVTPEGGYTELVDENSGTPTATIFSEYKTGQDTTVTADFAGSAANTWSGNALEIRAALPKVPILVMAPRIRTTV